MATSAANHMSSLGSGEIPNRYKTMGKKNKGKESKGSKSAKGLPGHKEQAKPKPVIKPGKT